MAKNFYRGIIDIAEGTKDGKIFFRLYVLDKALYTVYCSDAGRDVFAAPCSVLRIYLFA